MIARLLLAALLAAGLTGLAAAQKKKDQKDEKGRKGTVTGVVAAKGDNWIEIKADGEEKARKYTPHWRGGNPNAGGGPDKEIVAKIKETPLHSRVRIEWSFQERPRVEKIEVLKKGDDKKSGDKDSGKRSGTVSGEI